MANVLKKMMSYGSLSRPASPTNLEDEDTIVETPDSNTVETESIPNFAQQGITDHTTILVELLLGPTASVYVGKEQRPIGISKRLLIHHSPLAARLLAQNDTLALPDDDPLAFTHICRWMYQNKLGILPHRTTRMASDISAGGLKDACLLLCRIFAAANYLDIALVQRLVLDELRAAFTMAREEGECTPLTPSVVMEVWEDGGEESDLWRLVLQEMCCAFSLRPSPVYEVFDECFKQIYELRLQVGGAMADRIKLVVGGWDGGDGGDMEVEIGGGEGEMELGGECGE